MTSEFDLIARYFTRPSPAALLGVGDDAALLQPAPGMVLAVSSDMLVSGRHFFADADPYALGHKTLAVNLSDLAAMGARPRWATLSLALPKVDEGWLEAFSAGFFDIAQRFNVDLVGGDTTSGPLNLSVTVIGEVPAQQALRRDGAKVGDEIWVSGELGGAALGLRYLQGKVNLSEPQAAACLQRLHQPQPRVALGMALRGVASAAIDVSDGLLADLGHVLQRSGLGAQLELALIPAATALDDSEVALACLLAGGDDYELCFTAHPDHAAGVFSAAASAGVSVSRIGVLTATPGCRVLAANGKSIEMKVRGYDHFG